MTLFVWYNLHDKYFIIPIYMYTTIILYFSLRRLSNQQFCLFTEWNRLFSSPNLDRFVLHDQPVPRRHRDAVLGDEAARDGQDGDVLSERQIVRMKNRFNRGTMLYCCHVWLNSVIYCNLKQINLLQSLTNIFLAFLL